MKIVQTWCPGCITRILLSLCYTVSRILGLNKKKQQDNMRAVEEEEQPVTSIHRITTLESATKSIDDRTPISPETTQRTAVPPPPEQMFKALEKDILLTDHTHGSPTKQQPVKPQKHSEDLLEIAPPKPQDKKIPSSVTPVYLDTSSFKVILSGPEEVYMAMIKQKTSRLQELFNREGTQDKIENDPAANAVGLELRFVQSEKLNIFIYSFYLPCTYQFYSNLLNDYELQKSFDPNIDEYRLQEAVGRSVRINYLAYKKVLIISPRDFVYLKYSVNCGSDNYDIAFSVNHELYANKIRGDIIMNASKVVPQNNGIRVYVYSEVDMKLSVNPRITKNQGVAEIKKFVNKCDKYVRENFS